MKAKDRTPPPPDAKQYPPALVEFMMQRWKAQPPRATGRHPSTRHFLRRRAELSARFPGQTLIIPTGHEKVRANDTHFRFRPGSDFFWLTGHLDPDAVLVLAPRKGGHTSHLFVPPNPGRNDHTFFTDRVRGELWVGARAGVEQSATRASVDKGHPLEDLEAFLRKLPTPRLLRGLSGRTERLVGRRTKKRDAELATAISELRLIKDESEITALSAVIESTRKGFEDVLRALQTAQTEREVEGIFGLRARVEGNDVGYGTIAASGANACILHWTRNDSRLDQRSLLLLDAGVEGHALYTADITRTVPISGRFSEEQRLIYELVWRAQQEAIAAVRPGHDFMEPNRRAMAVLTQGLFELGILKVPVEEALKDEHQFHKRYSLHNVSHMLGLDVHDCAKARQENYKYGKLKPGMVLTIEPGLYFQLDDLTVPARFRGIGVRIEDDILVTRDAPRNLSASFPSEANAVEAWMRRVWTEAPR